MKLRPLVMAAAALLAAGSAHAITYSYAGALVTGPTFNRPLTLTSLSGVGTAVYYQAFSFTVSAAGSYDFLSSTSPAFDNYTLLYSPAFAPAAPLTGVLAVNDDFGGSSLTSSGFTLTLAAATTYVFVTTSFNNGITGTFTNTITGPGTVTPVPVPEPQTYGLMALGLALVGAALRRGKTLD